MGFACRRVIQVDDKKDDQHSGGHKGDSSRKGEGIVGGGEGGCGSSDGDGKGGGDKGGGKQTLRFW